MGGGDNGGLQEDSNHGVLPRTSAVSVLVPAVITAQPLSRFCRRPTTLARLETGELPFVLNGNCPHPRGAVVQKTAEGSTRSYMSIVF